MSWGSLHFPVTPNLSLEPPLFRKAYRKVGWWKNHQVHGGEIHPMSYCQAKKPTYTVENNVLDTQNPLVIRFFWRNPDDHPVTTHELRTTPAMTDGLHDRWRERLLRHRPCGDGGWHWGTLGWCGLGAPGMLFGWFFWRKKMEAFI